jgi:basic membrane lipoprotein Med (substrate-binding protein (PBP1-ABC) superfamily)
MKKRSNPKMSDRNKVTRSACFVAFLIAIIGFFVKTSVCAAEGAKPLKVAFLCVGSINDWGWNYAHNKGRLYLEAKMPKEVETTFAERIPESAEAERVLEKMVAQGNKLIFTTSYGYLEPALKVAARHPDVIFMQVNRPQSAVPNLATYFSNQYQPMYIAGVVAARVTKTNKLGFVAPHPVPQILNSINSFTTGARSVNPKATTSVVWINSWTDPATEVESLKSLAESGVDVVADLQDNQSIVIKSAEQLGVHCIGYYSDAHQFAPKEWLTGGDLDWGPLYEKIARSVIDHTWKNSTINSGLDGGYIKLSAVGAAVPPAVRKEALSLEEKVKSGKLVVLEGPIKDSQGKMRLAAGQRPDAQWLTNMDFFVQGVNGTLPKK